MFTTNKKIFIPSLIMALIAILALGSTALAQEDPTSTPTPAPMDETPMPPPTMDAPAASDSTLVVMGSGSAAGAPDQANIEIGVEITSDGVSDAFSQANSTIDDIIQALVDLGIAREDIQTTGLNIYTQQPPMGPEASGQAQTQYSISNRVRVIVRDVSQIEDVIDTAVSNGANNIFGLNFAFSDPTELIRDARAAAVENARANAEHLAELLGLSLGDVISVSETRGGGVGPYPVEGLQSGGAADSAVVESGQLSVSLQVELTYSVHNTGE